MKIKMLRTEKGSIDGIIVNVFAKDTEYDIPEKLAKVFISIKAAEEFKEEKQAAKVEVKVEKKEEKIIDKPYENKMYNDDNKKEKK